MSIVHKGYKHNFSFPRIISTVWEKLRAQEVSYEHTHTPQFVNHSSGKKKKPFSLLFFFSHNLTTFTGMCNLNESMQMLKCMTKS